MRQLVKDQSRFFKFGVNYWHLKVVQNGAFETGNGSSDMSNSASSKSTSTNDLKPQEESLGKQGSVQESAMVKQLLGK